MTVSYRTLAAIVGVVLVFGLAAAFVIGGDDDDTEGASGTTVTVQRNDEGGVKTEDDGPGGSSTSSSTTLAPGSTTSTTAGGATTTTATTAAPSATTSTTRRPGATTTTRPPAVTTTTQRTTTTSPPPPPPTTVVETVAELGVHVNISGGATARRAVVSVENAGPSEDVDFTLTVTSAGATVQSIVAGSFFDCRQSGSTVTCSASDVGSGGRVREVTIDYAVDANCANEPQLTASVASSNRSDPGAITNTRNLSLCQFAG